MKWPFVRRSKYEKIEDENKYLNDENQSLTKDIGKLINDINRLNEELANELNSHRDTRIGYKALNERNNYLDSIYKDVTEQYSLLKKELEETKEKYKKAEALFDYWQKRCLNTEGQLEETKEQWDELFHKKNEFSVECDRLDDENERLKKEKESLFQAYDKLNQQNMSLLFELQETKDKNNQLIIDKKHLKTKIKESDIQLSKINIIHAETKQQNDWFYGSYLRFKDIIEKSGYFNK